jgi:hypothetical protein
MGIGYYPISMQNHGFFIVYTDTRVHEIFQYIALLKTVQNHEISGKISMPE